MNIASELLKSLSMLIQWSDLACLGKGGCRHVFLKFYLCQFLIHITVNKEVALFFVSY